MYLNFKLRNTSKTVNETNPSKPPYIFFILLKISRHLHTITLLIFLKHYFFYYLSHVIQTVAI